jgi:hypothetical protein
LVLIVASCNVWATEVDNFTDRGVLKRDSLPALDAKVNGYLDWAVREANKQSPHSCEREVLRQEFVRWVGPDPVSVLEAWATLSDDVQKIPTSLKDSIYRDANFKESPMMMIVGIGRSFLLDGHIVGTDKLGHFFMQGLHYYKTIKEDGKPVDWVLRNEHGEDTIFGFWMTGVKSYGDMAANYDGLRFWNDFNEGPNPYVRCDRGHWVKARVFTWHDYVSDSWDEAINCSDYVPTLGPKVGARLAALGLSCPVDPQRCAGLAAREGAEYYVNPKCFALFGSGSFKAIPDQGPGSDVTSPPGVPQPVKFLKLAD